VGVFDQYADIEFAEAFPHPRALRATSPASGRGEGKAGAAWLTLRDQPAHDFVELLEVPVADLKGAAGIAMIDAYREP
jgi:hypothetical protein